MKRYIFILVIMVVIILIKVFYVPQNRQISPVFFPPTDIPQPSIAKPTKPPSYHLIKTAFVPQSPKKNWDQPWQDACEEAAMLTVKYYYFNQSPNSSQIKTDLQSIFDYETSVNLTGDVNVSQIATISAAMFQLKPTVITDPTLAIFKQYLLRDIPVIVPANGKILYKENNHFKSGGPWYHNLVVLGFDDSRQQFIVHDVGTQFGAYFRYSYSLLLEAIHDFPPGGPKENINQGPKNVLVLVK